MISLIKIECLTAGALPHVFWVTDGTHYSNGDVQAFPFIDKGITVEENMIGPNRLFGVSSIEYGSLKINNSTGDLDYLSSYILDGGTVTVYRLENEAVSPLPDPSYVLKITKSEHSYSEISLTLASERADLNVPIQTASFSNDPVTDPSSDLDGATEVRGSLKPRLFGYCTGVAPPRMNAAHQLYAVNFEKDGSANAAITYRVFDKGGMLHPDQDYETLVELVEAEVPPGHFATCSSEGHFKLGSKPKGKITADVRSIEDKDAIEILMEDSGIEYDESSLSDLFPTMYQGEGYYVTGSETYLEVLSYFLGTVFGYTRSISDGVIQFGLVPGKNLSKSPVAVISEDVIYKGSIKKLPPPTPDGLPVKALEVSYSKVYSPDENLVESMPSEERELRSKASQSLTLEASWNFHPLAKSMELALGWSQLHGFYIPGFIGTYPRDWWVANDPSDVTYSPEGGVILAPGGSVTYTYEAPFALSSWETELDVTALVKFYDPGDVLTITDSSGSQTYGTSDVGDELKVAITRDDPFVTLSNPNSNPIGIRQFYAYNFESRANLLFNANYRLNLLSAEQARYSVTCLDRAVEDCIVGEWVTLKIPRYSLGNGKDFLVIRRQVDGDRVTLELWRPEEVGFGFGYDVSEPLVAGVPTVIYPMVTTSKRFRTFKIEGQLPTGMGLLLESGNIAGTPSEVGTFYFKIGAIDGDGKTASFSGSLTVVAP